MKYTIEGQLKETTVHISLVSATNGSVEILGSLPYRSEWVIGTLTTDGRFLPNKNGCKELGLTVDNIFNSAL
jgi:hypothetical protein